MKWRLIPIMLVMVVLLAATPIAAQTEQSPGEIPAATGTDTPQPETSQVETPQLPVLTIVTSSGERVPVQVEIADTPGERQTGLMGRSALAEEAGMLFVFDQEQILSFWMKDTLIPLSIAYVDSEGRIVDIQDMQPLDETSHPSAEPAQYALEVNQGFFEGRGVAVGDVVELPSLQGEVGESEVPAEAPVAPLEGVEL
jgi:uncharacterized membrane protein (UPF0127 family)